MTRIGVLLVDDDPQILQAVDSTLRARGYSVIKAMDGEGALDVLDSNPIDLVLLDLGLPGLSGRDVIVRIRARSEVPIIVLSVQDAQDEKVAALDAGADDYLTKPFDTAELLARMRAVKRRAEDRPQASVLRYGDLEVDIDRKLVTLGGKALHLTPTEYGLVARMASNPGKLLTHQWLLAEVWGPGFGTESHYLRVFVRALRKKLKDDPANPRWITTEPGVGYRWVGEPTEPDRDRP